MAVDHQRLAWNTAQLPDLEWIMNLADGLHKYRLDQDLWSLTQRLEVEVVPRVLVLLAQYGDEPPDEALRETKAFLLMVEEWKSLCNRERMINAVQNSPRRVWDALHAAMIARTDDAALAAVMVLRGFGIAEDEETGQRRAKMATAVLRFLDPIRWGVVDWRNAAMLGLLKRANGDCQLAVEKAGRQSAQELRLIFDIIDGPAAIEMNEQYRALAREQGLAGAAEADMALFGLSLVAWPLSVH